MSRMTPQQVMQACENSDESLSCVNAITVLPKTFMCMQMADMQRQMANLPPGFVQQQMAAMNSMDPAVLQQHVRDATLHTSGQTHTPAGRPSHSSPQEVRSSFACLSCMHDESTGGSRCQMQISTGAMMCRG